MMPGLAQIYGPQFFADWGPAHKDYVATASVITDILVEQFRPQRLADIGCGCGVYAYQLAERGVEVVALDGVQPPPEHRFPVPIQLQDLTVPFENRWGTFDLALCLEVAEHIPEQFADVFIENLTRFSDTLVLSAAPPGQGGHHHVNEQPRRYWVAKLARFGFAYDRARSGRLCRAVAALRPPYQWMIQHAAVYARVKDPRALGRTLPFAEQIKR